MSTFSTFSTGNPPNFGEGENKTGENWGNRTTTTTTNREGGDIVHVPHGKHCCVGLVTFIMEGKGTLVGHRNKDHQKFWPPKSLEFLRWHRDWQQARHPCHSEALAAAGGNQVPEFRRVFDACMKAWELANPKPLRRYGDWREALARDPITNTPRYKPPLPGIYCFTDKRNPDMDPEPYQDWEKRVTEGKRQRDPDRAGECFKMQRIFESKCISPLCVDPEEGDGPCRDYIEDWNKKQKAKDKDLCCSKGSKREGGNGECWSTDCPDGEGFINTRRTKWGEEVHYKLCKKRAYDLCKVLVQKGVGDKFQAKCCCEEPDCPPNENTWDITLSKEDDSTLPRKLSDFEQGVPSLGTPDKMYPPTVEGWADGPAEHGQNDQNESYGMPVSPTPKDIACRLLSTNGVINGTQFTHMRGTVSDQSGSRPQRISLDPHNSNARVKTSLQSEKYMRSKDKQHLDKDDGQTSSRLPSTLLDSHLPAGIQFLMMFPECCAKS